TGDAKRGHNPQVIDTQVVALMPPGCLRQRKCVSDEISLAEGDSGGKVRGMETATENPAHPPREDLVWLARPLLELAQERSLEGVLPKAIDAAAAVPGVALARVYLLEPGDIRNAVVSGGHWLHGATEQWLRQEDDYRRVPLRAHPAGRAVTKGETVVGRKGEGEGWIADPALAEREHLLGSIYQPI